MRLELFRAFAYVRSIMHPCRSQMFKAERFRHRTFRMSNAILSSFAAVNRTVKGLDHARDREVAICGTAMNTAIHWLGTCVSLTGGPKL
jgi:hypothetical protein